MKPGAFIVDWIQELIPSVFGEQDNWRPAFYFRVGLLSLL